MLDLMLGKLISRKFWVALSGAVALFVGDGLGLPQEGQILGGVIMAVWLVVEGVLDFTNIRTQNAQLRQLIGQMNLQMQGQAAAAEKARAAARGEPK